MRYFYVTYSAKGVTGACTVTVKKFINHKSFIKGIKESYPKLNNIFILSWVEMTKEDYLVFIEEK